MISRIGGHKQKHRSAGEWYKLVSAWRESGKTKRSWCTENGLSLESLRRWIKRFRGGAVSEMPIVEVPRAFEALGAISAIRVLLHPAIQIELPVDASQELLRRVLGVAVEVAHVR